MYSDFIKKEKDVKTIDDKYYEVERKKIPRKRIILIVIAVLVVIFVLLNIYAFVFYKDPDIMTTVLKNDFDQIINIEDHYKI